MPMEWIKQRYCWVLFDKNNKRKLIVYIYDGEDFYSLAIVYFYDVRFGVLRWITLSDVFFIFIRIISNYRDPPLINSKNELIGGYRNG